MNLQDTQLKNQYSALVLIPSRNSFFKTLQVLQGRPEQEIQTPVAVSPRRSAAIQIDTEGKYFAHRIARRAVVGALRNIELFPLVTFLDFFLFFGCSPKGIVETVST